MANNSTITAPAGFRAAGVACGIKDSGNLDLGLLVGDKPCTAAAVFTQNRFCGAPIVVGRDHLRKGKLHAVVVNSGCANVATGQRGERDALAMCQQLARKIDADPTQILPASTGIIGEFLPMTKIRQGITQAGLALADSAEAGAHFARAIMTTDTVIKQAIRQVKVGKETVTLAGCCKGSGMIAPNMATMLAYLTTDANVAGKFLRDTLQAAVEQSFNRITVDECPSTSDMAAILASGMGPSLESRQHQKLFADALSDLSQDLAYQIVADGEGATRVLEVIVLHARSQSDAHAAARAIAISPLVKTAVHGGDPNWGRIIQALGISSAAYRPERVRVKLGPVTLFAQGKPVRGLNGKRLASLMNQTQVTVTVDLQAGKASDRVLTCDFSKEYVTINADYHT